jgi:hypothetical protein
MSARNRSRRRPEASWKRLIRAPSRMVGAVTAFMECTVADIIERGAHVMRTYAAWPDEKPAPPVR